MKFNFSLRETCLDEMCWKQIIAEDEISSARWNSVAHNRCRLELPACNVFHCFPTRVEHIFLPPIFLPPIIVPRFSLRLIFGPFVILFFCIFQESVIGFHCQTLPIKLVLSLCVRMTFYRQMRELVGDLQTVFEYTIWGIMMFVVNKWIL